MNLAKSALSSIRSHGEETYPEECCGFLVGRTDDGTNVVSQAMPVTNNHSADRRRRFLIRAEDYLKAERVLRNTGSQIVGIYHSHPDHPAEPSAKDLEDAAFVSFSYVITSVRAASMTEVRSWRLLEDRSGFDEEPIRVIEETPAT